MIKNFKLKAGILSIFLTPILVGSGLSPILPDVAKFVGSDGAFLSKLFLTLPSLAVIPFLFLSSILTFYFKKRNLVIFGLLLYIISGLGCILSFNIFWLMFFRVMLGVGAGFVVPYSNSLFADYFVPNKRFKMISYAGVLTFVGGVVILLLAGLLSQLHWRLAFLVHFVAFIPLWFLWKYVPHPLLNSVHTYPMLFSFVLKPKVWLICVFYFICMTLVFIYFSNISFLIVLNKLGGNLQSAYAQSLYMLFAVLSNFAMIPIKKISNDVLYLCQFTFICIAFLFLSFLNNYLYIIYVSSILLGLGFGSLGNGLVSRISELTSKVNRVGALVIFFSGLYLGQFVSPLFFKYLLKIFAFDENNSYIVFLITAMIFLMFIIVLANKMFIKNIKN